MKDLTERERNFVYKRLFMVIEQDIINIKLKDESAQKANELSESRKALLELTEFKKVGFWKSFTREDIMTFMEENNLDCLRFCDECGTPFWEGYITEDSDVYCSLKCLGMTQKQFDKQYSDEEDCTFYTEWV